ncbi:putative inactive protein RESTRICTED TEV MOVEMENT 2-like [Heracleum sosnowskyi]|uniref:Inactive protein RESTRICTED TEV MOVEMENT 2-like n=1 Tax=Heracleum sosnowskyi TaxID=360622 RepID=A0AAD8ID83_9APIA|nr:putative inactive protein RESTRICTED TEV MOVEMENT 2-like [Heracleum sosnowskyi]
MEAMQRSVATRVYQDFVPLIEIVEEPQCNTLAVYLPGFKKEQLRVQLTRTRNLVISGEHPIGENTWQRFKKTIPIPANCDSSKITAKFEDLILYITQPKLIASVEKQDQEKPTSNPGDLTAEKKDQENPSTETYKHVDENEDPNKGKQVSDHKEAENADVERKEAAEERVEKLGVKGNVFKNVAEDSNDGKTVSDNIPEVEQTKNTAETGKMNDQKHKTYSGNFSTTMNVQKKVMSIVFAVLVAIAFGFHVYYLVGREKKAVKEDL